jgi:tRNA A37 threonylcarbamoyladenosine dehydratase
VLTIPGIFSFAEEDSLYKSLGRVHKQDHDCDQEKKTKADEQFPNEHARTPSFSRVTAYFALRTVSKVVALISRLTGDVRGSLDLP